VKCSFDERGCAAGSGEGVSVPAVGKIPVELARTGTDEASVAP